MDEKDKKVNIAKITQEKALNLLRILREKKNLIGLFLNLLPFIITAIGIYIGFKVFSN